MDFLIFVIDIEKPATNIWNLMIQNKNQNILYTLYGYAKSKLDTKIAIITQWLSFSSR